VDPRVTWKDLQRAYLERNWGEVIVLAEGLLDWLSKGGTAPDTRALPAAGEDWDRFVCLAVVEAIRTSSRARRQ
jgi:hypothetical protein